LKVYPWYSQLTSYLMTVPFIQYAAMRLPIANIANEICCYVALRKSAVTNYAYIIDPGTIFIMLALLIKWMLPT